MLNEELNIGSDDELNLEIQGETESEDLSNEMSQSESESETSVVCVDMTAGDKKPKAYTLN
jgi:hypothetical protein